MSHPSFAALIGGEPDRVETLLDYGYRAVWKAWRGTEAFIIKKDERPGRTEQEHAAQASVGRAGVPIPELLGVRPAPDGLLAMRWARGVPLHDRQTAAALRDAGRVLRLAHSAPAPRAREDAPSTWMTAWFENEADYIVNEGVVDRASVEALRRGLERLGPTLDAAPRAWLHGDCQAAHFLIDPASDSVAAVIDWADAQQGPVDLDFSVLMLELEAPGALEHLLDGYGAGPELRARLGETLLLCQAIRGSAVVRWLRAHGYPDVAWPARKIREFAARGDA